MKDNRKTNGEVEILIAEDSPTQAARLAQLLEQGGFRVTTAANGREALALLERRRPKLVISDILMPELDGYGLCKAIKADKKLKDIPVMLVTTLADPQDVIRGLECGADNLLRKPYEERYLLSRIDYLLMNLELRKNQKMQMGMEINLGGQKYFISAERQQILDLLISTYEQAVEINNELRQREKDLAHSNEVLNALYRIAEGLNQARGEREVAESVLERALELPGIQAGWISLREGESGFRLAAARNLPPALDAPGAMDGDCTCRRRLLSGEFDAVTNVLECERLEQAGGDTRGLRYHASIPLRRGDRTLGVMNLVGPEMGLFNEDELKVLYSVGNQVAVALERAHLHDHLEQLVAERTAKLEAEIAVRQRAEKRFHILFEFAPDAIVMVDQHGIVALVNRQGEALFGYRRDELLGQRVETLMPEAFRLAHAGLRQGFLNNATPRAMGRDRSDLLGLRKDGTVFPVDISLSPMESEDGVMVAAAVRDVTLQKEHERRITRLNRMYAVLSGINTLIVRVHDRDELFREACRIAVEVGGFSLAWLAEIDRSAMQLKPVAWAGTGQDYVEQLPFSLNEADDEKFGLAGRAVLEKKPIIVEDLEHDPRAVLRREAAERNLHSLVMLPLVASDRVIGVLAFYANEIGFFIESEMKLLLELTGDIAFAVENIGRQKDLAKLARIRAVSSEINAAIIRVHDREELFREACRIAVEHGQFKMAWIGVVDQGTMKIAPIASAGVDAEFLTLIKDRFSLLEDAPLGNTMSARAVREKKAMVSNEMRGDSNILFANERIERGIASMAILPLLVADDAVGILALYAGEIGFFDEEEMKLLTEMTGDIGFALDHIEKQARLDYLAYYDVLTGLANRSLFVERVAQYMRSAAGGGHKLAVFLIDLERFKNINDSLGRPAGDELLRQVAQWLARNTGEANLVARVGADHFAAVLPKVKADGNVAQFLENMMAAFLEHPFRLNDAVFRIAARVGAALFPDDGADAETLFRNAEAALKMAKSSGERYLFHTQKMTETVAGKLTLENQLRQALDRKEFALHYQPKVNLLSGMITGAEALIRWNDPRTGLVPPGRFIPILEETGLIYDVGRWALRQAIEDYLRWRSTGLPAVRIAVNVSPLQLRHRGFVAEIEQVIGVDAHAAAGLELEITESLIMEDIKHNIASLQAIRALGVRIGIDDFGTGFSSLSYLAKLPVDTLKIDRSFVIDMTASPEGLALVSTIISLAHSLKLTVVAEGVETEEQSRLLRLLACNEMQGFLFSKPVPVEIFETRFLARPSTGSQIV